MRVFDSLLCFLGGSIQNHMVEIRVKLKNTEVIHLTHTKIAFKNSGLFAHNLYSLKRTSTAQKK